MKKVLVLGVLTAFATGVWAQQPAAEKSTSSWKSSLSGLEIGTRILYTQLKDDQKGDGLNRSFIGTLNYLDEEQDYVPDRIYIQYFFNEYIGLGVSYDHIEAKTLERNSAVIEGGSGAGDGKVGARGAILYAVGRYPTDSAFTPFAEIGVGFYSSYFDEDADWKYDNVKRRERHMNTDNATAFVLGLGCDYQINDNWSVNVYGRLVAGLDIDTTADYVYKSKPSETFREGSFPLDYYGFGVGVKYAF
ncbi:MAG: hypothetical protein M5U15_00550 [Kiritimatiellae bacterium]|nr:hypothetical protein [Kiritimatiellia bacterium]